MSFKRPVWLPVATLALSMLLMQLPLQRQLARAVDDALLRAAARPANFNDVLVVDFDDASLRALQPQLGPWPYSRAVDARLLQTLRKAGAASVIFDIVFAGTREGDDRFAAALAERPDTTLAAAARRDADMDEVQPPEAIEPFSTQLGADSHLLPWPAVMLPAPQLLQALTHPGALGVISTSLDADGHLRRLPLLHDVAGRVLPHLALAALLLESQAPLPLPGKRSATGSGVLMVLGPHRWPLDAQGAAHLVLPSNLASLPTLPASALLMAAGTEVGPALRKRIEGRHVFVGSSAFFGDVVTTPQGRLHGTVMVAGAYEALRRDAVLAPAGVPMAALLLLLALAPVLRVVWRGRPLPWSDAAFSLGLVLLIGVGAWAAGRYGALQVSPTPALSCLLIGFALTLLLQLRSAARANRELHERQLAAEAANRAKSEFLAGVSHELRTPLHAVLGMADVLSRTPLAPQQQRYVEVFRTAGQNLVSLIDDLLDLSRIEAGQLALDPRPFVLVTLLDEVRLLLQPRAAAKGLTLTLAVDAGSEPPVGGVLQGDSRRLRQVLVNLIANAIKFTAAGSITVRLNRDPQGWLRVRVSDTGIGIAAAEQQRIFQPFVQADGSITRRFGGTGLGLSISNDLVHLMGGTIRVESEPGRGSTFEFVLPMLPTTEVPAPERDPPTSADTAPGPGASILLAEDNEVNVMVLEAMLDGTGHRVRVVNDGAEAVACFAAGRFDLVLMDVQMFGMDGHTATRAIRALEAAEHRSRTTVIALTANAFETERQASFAAGCDGHLVKPLQRATLLETIEHHRAVRQRA